ncbi:hypothetical protein BK699_35610 [Bacillus thuringiensis serovar mexicanensis]|uniref:Uncharacterized protein n=2 Tax=Bacillus TaxID=1386 RepID=A0A242VYS1_BACTU|nr:hypothetical protein BK699_35610 [Bacillus thuringiensis serovar mexicanensis]OTW95071.1 hypothetical protein BK705_34030 [Bacillus thuringiensis serovar monterrey]
MPQTLRFLVALLIQPHFHPMPKDEGLSRSGRAVMEKGIKAGYDFYTHDYYGVSWSLAIIVYCIYAMKNYYVETNK